MKRISGKLGKDGNGNLIQNGTGFSTKGYEPPVAQVDSITGETGELTSNWTNNVGFPFETFTSSGVDITSAINSADIGYCQSDAISMTTGVTYRIEFDITINSGAGSIFYKFTNGSDQMATAGHNSYDYVPSSSGSELALFAAITTGVDFSITNFKVTALTSVTVSINSTDIVWSIADGNDMATEYEELFGLVNATSEPVTATYVSGGDHSQGIYITADVVGVDFTCTLSGETGTLARSAVAASQSQYAVSISRIALTTTEVAMQPPKGAVAIIIRGDDEFYVDNETGVGPTQGLVVIADEYIQLPLMEGETIYLEAATTANVSFAFPMLEE